MEISHQSIGRRVAELRRELRDTEDTARTAAIERELDSLKELCGGIGHIEIDSVYMYGIAPTCPCCGFEGKN